jgi:hypothetical protein
LGALSVYGTLSRWAGVLDFKISILKPLPPPGSPQRCPMVNYILYIDTIAGYRQKLLEAGTISGDPSILIVVGRQDTGELEAQIRGSRHAWDIRLISAEALIKLVKLKENSEDPETGRKIRSVLSPLEYTRLDRLVDVMFTAATDAVQVVVDLDADNDTAQSPPPVISSPTTGTAATEVSGTWEFTDPALLQNKRDQIVKAMSGHMGAPLIKKSRALFWSADHSKRIACTISKRYMKRASYPYWYAFHPQWEDFLKEGEDACLVLGCMDLPKAFVIPVKIIQQILPDLNTTETDRGVYWHLHIVQRTSGEFELLVPKRSADLDLSPYAVDLAS